MHLTPICRLILTICARRHESNFAHFQIYLVLSVQMEKRLVLFSFGEGNHSRKARPMSPTYSMAQRIESRLESEFVGHEQIRLSYILFGVISWFS